MSAMQGLKTNNEDLANLVSQNVNFEKRSFKQSHVSVMQGLLLAVMTKIFFVCFLLTKIFFYHKDSFLSQR